MAELLLSILAAVRVFLLHWCWRSRGRGGRPRAAEDIPALILRIEDENPSWGAPKIHGELQKLGFAVSERTVARYPILDRDTKFDSAVSTFLQSTGLTQKRTSVQAPWQNGIAERWVGTCWRELLDHVIIDTGEELMLRAACRVASMASWGSGPRRFGPRRSVRNRPHSGGCFLTWNEGNLSHVH